MDGERGLPEMRTSARSPAPERVPQTGPPWPGARSPPACPRVLRLQTRGGGELGREGPARGQPEQGARRSGAGFPTTAPNSPPSEMARPAKQRPEMGAPLEDLEQQRRRKGGGGGAAEGVRHRSSWPVELTSVLLLYITRRRRSRTGELEAASRRGARATRWGCQGWAASGSSRLGRLLGLLLLAGEGREGGPTLVREEGGGWGERPTGDKKRLTSGARRR
jgi:hypothetical protein